MSFREDSRVQAAIALLKSASKVKVSEDSLVEFLENETGGSVHALRDISFESLEASLGIPRALARSIATSLRPKKAKEAHTARTARLRALNASEASPEELVAEVCKKPLQRNSKYFRSLKRLIGDAAVMVWVDGAVDQAATLVRVNDSMKGQSLKEIVIVNDQPIVPLALGVSPEGESSDHPLFPGKKLYSDGTGEDGLNWGALNHRTRLFLAFLVSRNAIDNEGDVFRLSAIYESAKSGAIFASHQKFLVEFNQIMENSRLHIFSTKPARHTSRLSGSF